MFNADDKFRIDVWSAGARAFKKDRAYLAAVHTGQCTTVHGSTCQCTVWDCQTLSMIKVCKCGGQGHSTLEPRKDRLRDVSVCQVRCLPMRDCYPSATAVGLSGRQVESGHGITGGFCLPLGLGLATLYVYTIKRNQLTAAGIVNALRSSCGDRLELHQATCSWCCCAQRRWIVVVGVAFPGVYCVYHGRWRREIGTRLMLSYGNQSRHKI